MVQHRLPTVQPSRSRYGGENVFVRFGFVVCVIAFVCVYRVACWLDYIYVLVNTLT